MSNIEKLTIRAYKAEFGRPQTDVVSSYLAGLADPEASR